MRNEQALEPVEHVAEPLEPIIFWFNIIAIEKQSKANVVELMWNLQDDQNTLEQ